MNGKLTGVDPRDRGLAYGDGLFETMAAAGGAIRWLDYHLERLVAGCERLAIPAPRDAELRREIAAQTPPRDRAVIKVIVTRGIGARGYRPPADAVPTVIVGAAPWPSAHSADPVALVTCATRLGENPHLAGLKHLCRLEHVLAQLELQKRGLDEGLLLSTSGHVVSATSNNVFAAFGARVCTPRLDRCGVRGVMRRLVLEACVPLGLVAQEVDLDVTDLTQADELFVTNSLFGVRPVCRLDDQTYAVGPVTRRLAARLGAIGSD
ncbi:MAG TPA: aminodeoxychorismate lyase [Gammaproteobacteria bacterium]